MRRLAIAVDSWRGQHIWEREFQRRLMLGYGRRLKTLSEQFLNQWASLSLSSHRGDVSLDEYIIKAAQARGLTVEQINLAMEAIEEGANDARMTAKKFHQKYLKTFSGRPPTPEAILTLALDDVVSEHVAPRKRRAEIIVSIMRCFDAIPESMADPVSSTMQRLRNSGR